MKKFRTVSVIRTIAVVLAVLLVLEGGARLLSPHLPDPQVWTNPYAQAKYERLAELREQQGGVEILLMGSSIVNASIDASVIEDQFGASTYNAAVAGSPITIWSAYLQDVAFDLACPRLVIYGVSPRDSNANEPGLESSTRAYRESFGRKVAIGEVGLLGRLQFRTESVSEFVRLRSLLRQPRGVYDWLTSGRARGWEEVNLDEYGRFPGFGHDRYESEDRERQVDMLEDGDFTDYEAGGEQFEALEEAIVAGRANGTEAAIIDMPAMSTALGDAVDGGAVDLIAYELRLDALAERLGVPLLRLNEMRDRHEFFADMYHMNDLGTATLTRHIVAWLQSGDVPLGAGGCLT